MLENIFQRRVIKKLKELFPGCVILRNDPTFLQGVPDIIILFNDRWAMLEFKQSVKANLRPNQKYYVQMLDEMSFASFINPENEEDVLYDLQLAFGTIGSPRLS